jgi:hypothetical protein
MPPPPESSSAHSDNPDDSEEAGNSINTKGKQSTFNREPSTKGDVVNFVQFTAGIGEAAPN